MRDFTEVLKNYDIKGTVVNETRGPLLEIIEFEPAAGTRLKSIESALEDIRRELGVSSLRVEPSTDSNTILFELPAQKFETVDFKSLLDSPEFTAAKKKYKLPLIMGADIKGTPVVADLSKMPHLLLGGTTGSGKSVGLNTFILSLIAALRPNEVKFVLIDPKKIEFSVYNNQKYLATPVVTETAEAIGTLAYLANEMDRRYELFSENMSKNLAEYNEKGDGFLPYIVCVIDEFADLMAMDKNVEKNVMRLAQKARAAGIHLILATQRPSVDVVTGVLKANFPTRLAYKVASNTDSRTILDTTGAENLIGRGDSLFLAADGTLTRLHGAYMPDEEIVEMLAPYKGTAKPFKLPETATKETTKEVTPKADAPKKKGESVLMKILKFWKFIPLKYRNRIKEAIIAYVLLLIQSKSSSKKKKR